MMEIFQNHISDVLQGKQELEAYLKTLIHL